MRGLGDVLRADHEAIQAKLMATLQGQQGGFSRALIQTLDNHLEATLHALADSADGNDEAASSDALRGESPCNFT